MIDAGSGGTKTTTTINVIDIFGVKFNKDAPITYLMLWGILVLVLLLLARLSGSFAVGLAFTVLLAVAFSHR